MRYHPFAHTGLKIVSVALAVLLWMMVSSQRASVERGLRIPLELQNLPDNLEMVEPPPESVDVRVRGTADTLSRLGPGDLVASIDLNSAQPSLPHLVQGEKQPRRDQQVRQNQSEDFNKANNPGRPGHKRHWT